MEEVTEEIKRELLEVISNVEASLPLVKEAIKKGEISTGYRGLFWTSIFELPTRMMSNPIELSRNKATFSFVGPIPENEH